MQTEGPWTILVAIGGIVTIVVMIGLAIWKHRLDRQRQARMLRALAASIEFGIEPIPEAVRRSRDLIAKKATLRAARARNRPEANIIEASVAVADAQEPTGAICRLAAQRALQCQRRLNEANVLDVDPSVAPAVDRAIVALDGAAELFEVLRRGEGNAADAEHVRAELSSAVVVLKAAAERLDPAPTDTAVDAFNKLGHPPRRGGRN